MGFMGLFKKKTEQEKELEYEKEIIENNINENALQVTAKVIMYVLKDNSENPDIMQVCDFHANILPEKNSIIWAANANNTELIPYKVLRYDFIEDPESEINRFVYIVVKPAFVRDITDIELY